MADQPKEVITIEEVFSNARKASTLPSPMDKGIKIYMEHWIDLKELRICDTHLCEIHHFFECDSLILPELIYQFWTNMELRGKEEIISKVLGQEVTINIEIIAKATECPRVDNSFYDYWDLVYKKESKVEKLLYGKNFKPKYVGIELIYKDLTSHAKILQHVCSSTFLHKNSARDHIIKLSRFAIYHMMTVRSHKFNTRNLKQMKLEVKKLNKVPL
ncbi:uncharacterized protein HKW66_Vig0152130 [Vigna angularis]|uniref:Uncharacterized protein n=1 Tax=Phaseolus angularis TaxID=3914 RepID=A0A8T0JU34_PHAAN|nr:uncharacterized protein HKW66_Vig0152130 [Vigna angularis]